MGLDASFWRGRRVLVTGHSGFKGSWLALWLEHLGAEVSGLGLVPEHEHGAYVSLAPQSTLRPYWVDVRDAEAVRSVVEDVDPEVIFHLAAQALVRRGLADPVGTFATNVLGTAHVLEAAAGVAPALRALVVVTSDKVYRNRGEGRPFTEDDELGGADPYSASKAAAEVVVASWRQSLVDTEKCGLATARAGNVIGGGDTGEDRLLVDAWDALRNDHPLRLRCPDAVRPWQFVLEPLAGYLLLAQRLDQDPVSAPSALNFGPPATGALAVRDLAARVFACWGAGRWEQAVESPLVESTVLRLDAERARQTLGWQPRLDLDTAVEWTVDWWRAAQSGRSLRELALHQIADYEALLA